MLFLGLSRDHCVSNYAANCYVMYLEICVNYFLKMFGDLFFYFTIFGNVNDRLYYILERYHICYVAGLISNPFSLQNKIMF